MLFRAEERYAKEQPFADSQVQLKDACLQVLQDFAGNWLSRSTVEYLLFRGGYVSEAMDPSNSVDVTLRSLAEKGLCQVERQRGPTGNRYTVEKGSGQNPVKESGTTKTTTGER